MQEQNAPGNEMIIFEYVQDTHSAVSNANSYILKPIAASEAFRRYNWLKMAPELNKAGNLRGMVISKDMRVVYQVSGKVADKLAVVGALIELGKELDRAQAVLKSDADNAEKTSRIMMLGSAAILRSVTSVVPTAVEIIALSVKGYAGLFSAVTGSPKGDEFGESVSNFAKEVRQTHTQQWDGENWYNFVEATLH